MEEDKQEKQHTERATRELFADWKFDYINYYYHDLFYHHGEQGVSVLNFRFQSRVTIIRTKSIRFQLVKC